MKLLHIHSVGRESLRRFASFLSFSALISMKRNGTAKMRIPKTHPRMSPNNVSLFCFFILVVHLPAVKEFLKRECDDRNYRKHDTDRRILLRTVCKQRMQVRLLQIQDHPLS